VVKHGGFGRRVFEIVFYFWFMFLNDYF